MFTVSGVPIENLHFDENGQRRLAGHCDEWETGYPVDDPIENYFPDDDPVDAMLQYQQANGKFPLRPIGQCGDPDGFDIDKQPASPARPMLFLHCMFPHPSNNGTCLKNFNHRDLPIVDTYFDDEGRPVDAYNTLRTNTPDVDLFPAGVDGCRPVDYVRTKGFFFYGSPDANLGYGFPAPTIKNCKGRQGLVRFENADSRAPISVHLHGAASAAPYDGWADDVTNTSWAKNYFYPNNRPTTLWYVLFVCPRGGEIHSLKLLMHYNNSFFFLPSYLLHILTFHSILSR